jgi:hypothetical protein
VKKLACALAFLLISTGHADTLVPFRAVAQTQTQPGPGCSLPGPCVSLVILGSGQANQLGRFTLDGPSEIYFLDSAQSGRSVLTAADGSTIEIAFGGSFVPGAGPGEAIFEGTWNATTGTGRFAGVQGGGTYDGEATGPTGVLRLRGWLNRGGAR